MVRLSSAGVEGVVTLSASVYNYPTIMRASRRVRESEYLNGTSEISYLELDVGSLFEYGRLFCCMMRVK